MRVTKWLQVALLAILLAGIGAGLLWTTLMVYDDEGYVQHSLRAFAATGGLYEKVFSQYGPFFYLWNWLLQLAGIDINHTTARILTLFYWLAAAGFSAAIVARLTGSAVATGAVLSGVFLHLWPMISEPLHPGGLICALVAGAAWLGIHEGIKPGVRGAFIGAIGATLVLTKINVGIFLLAGAGAWWVLAAAAPPGVAWRRAVTAGLLLLPVAVMHHIITTDWVATFAFVSAAAGIGIRLSLPARLEPPVPWQGLWRGLAAGTVVTCITVVFMRLTGTSWAGLLEGVILGPLRHPTAYAAFVKWRPGVAVLAVFSVLLLVWLVRKPADGRLAWVAGARILAAIIYLLCWSGVLPLDMHAFALSYGLTALPWFVLSLRESDRTAGARAWLALLCVTQALHAFPVAGSQISWGTFLWLPLAALGVCDTLQAVVERHPRAGAGYRRLLLPAGVTALVAWNCWNYSRIVQDRQLDSDSLGLRGAETLQLPQRFTSAARILSQNAALHAEPLFTLPGMLSFNYWSDISPPTTLNTTHWFTLLDVGQQAAIRARLEASPRACLIVQRHVYDFLKTTHIATESPLTQWLHANFTPAFSLESYEFWVRNGRTIAALGTAQLRQSASGASPRYRLDIVLARSDLDDVTRVTLERFDGTSDAKPQEWNATNSTLRIIPLNPSGDTRGRAIEAAWPFSANGLVQIEIYTDVMPVGFHPGIDSPHRISALHFRNAKGRVVAEARFVD